MDKGPLVQLGTPRELYDRPADAFVADLIGEMNLLPGTAGASQSGACEVQLAGGAAAGIAPAPLEPGAAVRLAVRPEHVLLAPAGAEGHGLRGRLVQAVFNGATTMLIAELPDGTILRANVGTRFILAELEPGAEVAATWRAEEAIVFAAGPA